MVRHLVKRITILSLLLSFIAQMPAKNTFVRTDEKLFVHTDRVNYISGDTVWFRAYLLDFRNGQLNDYSHYLYAELLEGGKPVARQMIINDKGVFAGYLPLPDSILEGSYYLRFYTRYLSSLPEPTYFYRQIVVGKRLVRNMKNNAGNSSEAYNVSFLPEGGSLPLGCPTRIAFKALDSNGLGENVSGIVIDSKGDTITSFYTFHRGMGFFELNPEEGETYTAVCRNATDKELRFPLPKAEPSAVDIRADLQNDFFVVSLRKGRKTAPTSAYAFRVLYRDSILLTQPFEGDGYVRLRRSSLPSGVLQLVLIDRAGTPLSGRTIFNRKEDVRCYLDCSAKPLERQGKSFWNISLGLQDNAENSADASLSISVTDNRYAIQDTSTNILSHFLLTSDIHGYVEDAAFYFSDVDSRADQKLDLLMLTQGWVKFSAEQNEVSRKDFGRFQSVSGRVVSESSDKKPVPNATVTLFSFDKSIASQTISNADGYFRFDSLYFPQGTVFVVQALKQNGGKDVALLIDRDSVPIVSEGLMAAEQQTADKTKKSDSVQLPSEQQNPFRQEKFAMEGKISEVVISAPKLERKKHIATESSVYHSDFNKVFYTDVINSPYSSMRDMLIKTPGLALGSGGQTEFVYLTRMSIVDLSLHPYPALLMVDGLEVSYAELLAVPISSVESIELIQDAAQMVSIGSKANKGVILVTTKPERDVAFSKASNFRVLNPIGYQVRRDFYVPAFPLQNGNNDETNIATVYWSPDFHVGQKPASLEIPAPGHKPLTIVVQGITADRKLIYFTRTLETE